MHAEEINLVILSGPVGVGKTTVAEELSGILEAEGVGHTFIDLDGLSKTYPRPSGDKLGEQLALKNLADVWSNSSELSVKNLIVARVVETRASAERIASAVGATLPFILQLTASDDSLLERVRHREIGGAREWHERRAVELAAILKRSSFADLELDTDERTVDELARILRERVNWVGG